MMRIDRVWLSAFLLLAVLSGAEAARTMTGRVTEAGTQQSVFGALVKLTPAVGDPLETYTGGFGTFTLEDTPDGDYALRVQHPDYTPLEEPLTVDGDIRRSIQLSRLVGETHFDIYIALHCVQSFSGLVGAQINVSRWHSQDFDQDPDPAQPWQLVADVDGAAKLRGVEPGYYQFYVTMPGWDDYRFPGTPVFFGVEQSVTAGLVPSLSDLKIEIRGYDPVADAPNKALKGVMVEITPMDLGYSRLLGPPVERITDVDGLVTFRDLPPVPHRVRAKKLGYIEHPIVGDPGTFETVVSPGPDQTFGTAPHTFNIALANTKLDVKLDSPYPKTDMLVGATVKLQGIKESATEGIDRQMTADFADEDALFPSVLFEHLLPGRYWVHVSQEDGTVSVQVPDPQIPPFQPTVTVHVGFEAKETYVDIDQDVTTDWLVDLSPIPATVYGRLMATDRMARDIGTTQRPFPHDWRVFNPRELDGIRFEEKAQVDLVPEDWRVVSAKSDEDGRFSVTVLPSLYGIRIPSLSNYSGHDITVLSAAQLGTTVPPTEHGWPYPDDFQYQAYEYGHHESHYPLNSGDTVFMNLHVQRHYVTLVPRVFVKLQQYSAPTQTAVLSRRPDPFSVPVSMAYDDLNRNASFILEGSHARHAINRVLYFATDSNQLIFRELEPGTYTVTPQHDRYQITGAGLDFSISPWTAPGERPPIAPAFNDPTYFFPGLFHDVSFDSNYRIEAEYGVHTMYTITQKRFNANLDPPDYESLPVNYNNVYTKPAWSDYYFRPGGNKLAPGGTYVVWYETDEGWYASPALDSAQDQELHIFIGGRENNVGTAVPGFINGAYKVEVHAVNKHHEDEEIADVTGVMEGAPGVPVHTTGDPNLPNVVVTSGMIEVLGPTHPQWHYLSQEFEWSDRAGVDLSVTLYFELGMQIMGSVRDGGANPVPDARVEVRDRQTSIVLATRVTDGNGHFEFTSLKLQPIYLEIAKRGFQRFRKRFASTPAQPNIDTGVLTLMRVKPPTISSLALDRFGLFLPGVMRSGDATAFDVENGRGNVTMTWMTAGAAPDPYQYTAEEYDDENGDPVVRTYTVRDQITDVRLIDKRWFPAPFINDPNQQESMLNFGETPDVSEMARLLDEIKAAKDDGGEPFYVANSIGEKQAARADDVAYQGKVELFRLPSGKPRFAVVFITREGGVRTMDYETPEGKKPLQGVRLPPWAATMLEAIGYASTFYPGGVQKTTNTDETNVFPSGKIKWQPKFDSGIDLNTRNYLVYEYKVGVALSDGGKAPEGGPLAAASRNLGLSFEGSAGFKTDGEAETVALSISGTIKQEKDSKSFTDYTPPILGALGFNVDKRTISASAKASVVILLGEDSDTPLVNNRLPEFEFRTKKSAFFMVRLTKDNPLIGSIPQAKPFLELLAQANIKLVGIFDIGVGGAIERTRTLFPPVPGTGGSTTVTPAVVVDLLGGADPNEQLSKITLEILAGLGAGIQGGEVFFGGATIQLGPPKDIVGQKGLKLEFNTKSFWPPITKVLGAGNIVVEVEAKLAGLKFGRSFVIELQRFEWKLAATPGAGGGRDDLRQPYHDISQIVNSETVTYPSDHDQTNVIDEDGTVLENLYDSAQVAVTTTGMPLLVFTSVNQTTGRMELLTAGLSDGTWVPMGTPIADAAYVTGMALAPRTGGGWLLVWMEIEAGDLGNLFAGSTVRYAVADAAGDWSAPETLADLDSLGLHPKLARVGDDLMLALLAADEGPVSSNRTIHTAVWREATQTWSPGLAPITAAPESVADYALAGDATGSRMPRAVLVTAGTDGMVSGRTWDGATWTAPTAFFAAGGGRVALTYPDADRPTAAYTERDDGGIHVSQLSPGGVWEELLAEPLSAAAVVDLAIAGVGAGETRQFLVAWSSGATETRLYHAFVNPAGEVTKDRSRGSITIVGMLKRLGIRPAADGTVAGDVFALREQFGSSDLMTFELQPDTDIPDGPTVVSSPPNATVTAGADHTLTVEATGREPLTYQWQKDHLSIDGATSPTLELHNVTEEDAAVYTVLVTDATGTSISEISEVNVVDYYVIRLQRGWSLVGMPVQTTLPVAELFVDDAGNGLKAGRVWILGPGGGRYLGMDDGEVPAAGIGLWVFSPTGGVTRPFEGTTLATQPLMLDGWNLISPVSAGPVAPGWEASGLPWTLQGRRLRRTNGRLQLTQGYFLRREP